MKIISAILILIISSNAFSSQELDDKIKQVKAHSLKLAKALETESLEETLSLFSDNATLLPEYHKSLWGKSKISAYYVQFFEKSNAVKFNKDAFEIMAIDEYFVELGTFEHQYTSPSGKDFEYKGKYVTYWQFHTDDTPKIMAHIWGSSSYFEPENLNFIEVDVPSTKAITPRTQWEEDIEEVRKFAYDAVFAGDSKKQLTTYAKDAIYMTYYDPPFIGKEKITEYFDSHYNPDIPMDSLMTRSVKVIDMGEYAFNFGEYYVEWTWERQPWYVGGKGLALHKRMADGSIKIYRQMINHSMPPTPKK